MRFTVRKLRVTVAVAAVLLIGGVVGAWIYGRRLARKFAIALPKKLRDGLLQESFNITFSHSEHGKTVYTVHAAKTEKWSNGLMTLEDVGIDLYGRQDGAADHIHGHQFEFDQAHGLLRAVGEVYIDLAAPAGGQGDREDRALHVKTSGLVFDQKLRTATTQEGIAFQAAGLTGTAVGASYDSVNQIIVLRSAVQVSGLRNGRPVALSAGYAELDRRLDLARLRDAEYVSPGQSLRADNALVHLTDSNVVKELDADGNVLLRGAERGALRGDRLQATMDEKGRVRAGHMRGSVQYEARDGDREQRGQANDLQVSFNAAGQPEHAVVTGGVALESRAPGIARSVATDKLDVQLADSGGKVGLRRAVATGGGGGASGGTAVLRVAGVGVKGRTSTEVRGDVLDGSFTGVGADARVQSLDGTGHTVVDQVGAGGVEERSTGATLRMLFAGTGREPTIERAVQAGAFQTVRTVPADPRRAVGAAPTVEHGTAAQAVFDGAQNRLVLSGQARVSELGDELFADTVTLDRGTGDAEAVGSVRVSYAQAAQPAPGQKAEAPGEPVHVVAARAVEHRAAGTAEFFGSTSGGPSAGDARMWQGGSQVAAPVLSFDQGHRTVVAHGTTASGDGDEVRTVLAAASGPAVAAKPGVRAVGKASGAPGTGQPGLGGSGGPVRVLSHTMTYRELAREVVFAGQVHVADRDGTLLAREATAFLAPAASHGVAAGAQPDAAALKQQPGPQRIGFGAAPALPASQVERIVATGGVEVEEPGRRSTGERLVYTSADRTFVMTGTPAAPPRVVDDADGTVTGGELRFRSGDRTVQVLAGAGQGNEPGRVRTETRVKSR